MTSSGLKSKWCLKYSSLVYYTQQIGINKVCPTLRVGWIQTKRKRKGIYFARRWDDYKRLKTNIWLSLFYYGFIFSVRRDIRRKSAFASSGRVKTRRPIKRLKNARLKINNKWGIPIQGNIKTSNPKHDEIMLVRCGSLVCRKWRQHLSFR